ncbi:glucoamylase [Rhodocollybia butyracea]|uniref:glucan 1,4-alpha-glucosidase n=1 Tax=Rhodocollybia butyracea TaxID=206335 RepID=A0A9P5UBV8_9AGAR|nr:glucoamylase [Rhodocollybia butyracea]
MNVASYLLAVNSAWAQSSTLAAYIASQSPLAKAGLLANIGPSGSKSSGALSGITIIDQYTLGLDTTTRGEIDNYVASQVIIQQVSNPSGTITTGGLGEPKFNIDETAFTGAWGRPQRDGPALRSNALITWANYLLKENNATYVTNTLWPIIQNDLNYVSQNWNQSTFDLWEEVDSSSFFTTAIQHRSLRQGVTLANAIGKTSVVSSWTTQAENVLCFLQSFWNTAGYITANTGGGRSGKDANTVLASIHTFDAAAGCDALTFQPCSDVALSNLLTYVNSFRSVYSLNSGIANNQAVATGRYPEDSYQGGNPWYLTTLAVAEQLYDSLIVWKAQGSLQVTSRSLPFFQLFDSSVTAGTYASTTSTFTTLTTGVQNYADGFVEVVAKHTPSDGQLSEQYSKTDGSQLSAVDLTWSYAATLTAFDARAGVVPASWGAAGLTTTCNAPSGGGGGGGGGSGTVAVTFNVFATTVFGQNIYICGSVDALQNWDPNTALLLSSAGYPTWSITVNLPASTSIQYKYLNIEGSTIIWESDPNMEITTPASGTWIENDTWR